MTNAGQRDRAGVGAYEPLEQVFRRLIDEAERRGYRQGHADCTAALESMREQRDKAAERCEALADENERNRCRIQELERGVASHYATPIKVTLTYADGASLELPQGAGVGGNKEP